MSARLTQLWQDSILALRLITGAMGCVSWLIIDLNPYLFLTDVLSGLSVYAGISCACCSSVHAPPLLGTVTSFWRWRTAAAVALSLSVQLWILLRSWHPSSRRWASHRMRLFSLWDAGKVNARVLICFSQVPPSQNHSHGLVWNPRGEELVVEELSGMAEDDGQVHP